VSAHIVGFSSYLWQHWGVQALTRHVDSLGGPLNYGAGGSVWTAYRGSHPVESRVATRLESIKPWDALSSPWVDRRPMTNSLERSLNRVSASQSHPQVTLAWPEGCSSGYIRHSLARRENFCPLCSRAGIEPHRFSPSATVNALTNRRQEQSLFLP
jgi:hypothetical protein